MSVILHAFLQRGETRSLVSLLPFGISNKVESRGFDYSLTQKGISKNKVKCIKKYIFSFLKYLVLGRYTKRRRILIFDLKFID